MSKTIKKPLFITLEGGEGVGKTTQINRLAEQLTRSGYKVITTREPGGTPEGEKIRSLFVRDEGVDWTPMAELLLVLAARSVHVERVVWPALEAGKIVLCDRFSDSTLAYQGYGRGLKGDVIASLTGQVIGGLIPDLTFVLDMPVELGLSRSTKRLAREGNKGQPTEDRFEKLDVAFHQRVREGFLDIARSEPGRCVVINAENSVESMAGAIWDAVQKKLV